MKKPIFSTFGESQALQFAKKQLLRWGYTVLPEPDTSTTHLILPVPTPAGLLLPPLPPHTFILGGNLNIPGSIDLLKDEYYLVENADITASCTMQILQSHRALPGAETLVIGWGRIGKALAEKLLEVHAHVTVAVRKQSDHRALEALGIRAVYLSELQARDYAMIINTAPAPVLDQAETSEAALLIDLASKQGIAGDRVIWARGLPNKMAPEASGALIAKTALRYALEKE